MIDAVIGKMLVMQALQRLVDDHLAQWHRSNDGRLELRLATGETFVLGDTGVTSQARWQDVASTPSHPVGGETRRDQLSPGNKWT